MRVLIDGYGQNNLLSARTNGGRLVHLTGSENLIGTFQNVKITGGSTWALFGEVLQA